MFRYLKAEALIEINKQAVAVNKDPHAILSEANLDYLIFSLEYKHKEDPDALIAKAAYLLQYLSDEGHVFVEGNKRTAAMATISFLQMNGAIITEVGEAELPEIILNVAAGKTGFKAIKKWLKERVKRK